MYILVYTLFQYQRKVYRCIYCVYRCIYTPRNSRRTSCPAVVMGSRTVRAFVAFILSLVSHTMGGTPFLAKALRSALDEMSMIGWRKSTGLPMTRVMISLPTRSDSGMGRSKRSMRTSRTSALCLAIARSAGPGKQSEQG